MNNERLCDHTLVMRSILVSFPCQLQQNPGSGQKGDLGLRRRFKLGVKILLWWSVRLKISPSKRFTCKKGKSLCPLRKVLVGGEFRGVAPPPPRSVGGNVFRWLEVGHNITTRHVRGTVLVFGRRRRRRGELDRSQCRSFITVKSEAKILTWKKIDVIVMNPDSLQTRSISFDFSSPEQNSTQNFEVFSFEFGFIYHTKSVFFVMLSRISQLVFPPAFLCADGMSRRMVW